MWADNPNETLRIRRLDCVSKSLKLGMFMLALPRTP